MTVTIVNDLHIGVQRKAGTTPASQAALTEYIYQQVEKTITTVVSDLIVLGDLFDSFTVDASHVVRTFTLLDNWLRSKPAFNLHLVAGNHDWSPKGDKVSSFHMLTHFLKAKWRDRVRVYDYRDGLTYVQDNIWTIPHMPNQDLFDRELDAANGMGARDGWLLLHANYDNKFAEQADHSLNVSADQAEALVAAGWNLVFGHEHQGREELGGSVQVIGNQFPTSIADCLGNSSKQAFVLSDRGCEVTQTWSADGCFCAVDWQDLGEPVESQFIRVTGTATAEQAAEVVSTIAKLRQNSQALVVGNAVRVDGVANMEALAEMSFDDVSKYDVLAALLEELSEKEGGVVKGLLNNA